MGIQSPEMVVSPLWNALSIECQDPYSIERIKKKYFAVSFESRVFVAERIFNEKKIGDNAWSSATDTLVSLLFIPVSCMYSLWLRTSEY